MTSSRKLQVVDRWKKVTEERGVTDLAKTGREDKQIERLTEGSH